MTAADRAQRGLKCRSVRPLARMLNSVELPGSTEIDYFPEGLRPQIEQLGGMIQEKVRSRAHSTRFKAASGTHRGRELLPSRAPRQMPESVDLRCRRFVVRKEPQMPQPAAKAAAGCECLAGFGTPCGFALYPGDTVPNPTSKSRTWKGLG
jgi:hypothetical protein